MDRMFEVRSTRALAPTALHESGPTPLSLLSPHALSRPRFACAPFDSAERKLLVCRQQAANPLRLGGYLGLRLRWLWPELGTGDLRLR